MGLRNKIVAWARAVCPQNSGAGWWGLTPEIVQSMSGSRYGGSFSTRAGVPVGPIDQFKLLVNVSCLGVIAKTMGAIPCRLNRRRKSGTVEVAESHPTNEVLSLKANDRTIAFMWQISSVFNRGAYGGSYSIKDYNELGQVTALNQCITPNVRPMILESMHELTEWDDIAKPGDVVYEITKTWPYGEKVVLPASRVLHIPYPMSLNGVIGIPPLRFMSDRVAIGKALQAWESDFFGKGFSPAFIAELGDLGKNKIDDVVESAEKSYEGFRSNHGIMAVAGKITQAQYRLDWAMLDKREQAVVEDVCGFWGVPPMLVCRSYQSSYNNSLEFFLQYRKLTIFPWTENDRQSYDCWLLNDAERRAGFFTAYDPKILDMQDGKAWADMMRMLFSTGSITPDEIRADMKLNPYPDGSGSVPYIQSQNIPLSDAGAESSGQTGDGLKVVESEAA